ncbi:hypothetical protein DFH07DRAFT_875746 [Mycena maculata]|uniref:Uncharacterized protein n=1 Tax=Mycena maculata TaxID=230809 RepID=A0AAD7K7U2_9AGAR|nr:hypothetical protein DFH07DRAFT_875746 [Mycena maculata]
MAAVFTLAGCSVLPPYTPSPPVPSYSPEPAQDEQRVEQTPRARPHPTGNYIKTCGRDAVVLTEQDSTVELPTYGHHGSINGFVTLEDRETVSEIILKIKGKMDVMISEGGSLTTKLVSDSYTLWSSQKSHTSACPSAVPFSLVIPSRFEDNDRVSHPLPPSYDVPYIAVPGLFFKSSYMLSVTIVRSRSRKFHFLNKSKIIPIRFIYSPRMRPWRPIQPSSDFFSDVKTMPEEWRQVVWQMKPRPKSSLQPLDLHLFLPTVEIFGLKDMIPFHVQLTGPVAALREFLPDPWDSSPSKTTIVGSLVRQISVDIHERKAARHVVIGLAKLSSRPPGAAADLREASLDWDGEVRCRADTLVGMFDAGSVRVQDFIVIELHPHNIQISQQFTTMRYSHPIKLVTDSWSDNREDLR